MIKEPLENPYPYFVGALVATATWVLTKIIWPIVDSSAKEKKQSWDNKIDHKDLKIQEQDMKSWVKEFLNETLKEFKVALSDFRKELKEVEDKMQKRNEKISQDYQELFNRYSESNHGRREQLEAANAVLVESLNVADRVLSKALKLEKSV